MAALASMEARIKAGTVDITSAIPPAVPANTTTGKVTMATTTTTKGSAQQQQRTFDIPVGNWRVNLPQSSSVAGGVGVGAGKTGGGGVGGKESGVGGAGAGFNLMTSIRARLGRPNGHV